jgi:hypothetical protein
MVWLHRAIVCSRFGKGRIECCVSSYRAIVAWLSAQHIVCYYIFIVWSWCGFSHHYTLFISLSGVWSGGWTDFLISYFSFLDPIIRVFLQDLVWLVYTGYMGYALAKLGLKVSFFGIILRYHFSLHRIGERREMAARILFRSKYIHVTLGCGTIV